MIRLALLFALMILTLGGCKEDKYEPPNSNENISNILALPDGGYVLAGTRTWYQYGIPVARPDDRNAEPSGVYLVRVNGTGEVVWQHSYELDVLTANDASLRIGNVVLSRTPELGFTCACVVNSDAPVCLLRVDSTGQEVWVRRVSVADLDYFNPTKPALDGGFFVSGSAMGSSESRLVRIDAEGAVRADLTISSWSLGYSHLRDFQPLDGQTLYALGYNGLFKVNAFSGGVQLTDTFNVRDLSYLGPLAQNPDSAVFFGGVAYSSAAREFHLRVYRFSANGQFDWMREYPESNLCQAVDAIVTPEGGCTLVGWPWYGNGEDAMVVNVNAAGAVVWSRSLTGITSYGAQCLMRAADGGYLIGGTTAASGDPSSADAVVIKLDASGNLLWQHAYGQ